MKGGDEMDLVVGAVYSIVILFYFILLFLGRLSVR